MRARYQDRVDFINKIKLESGCVDCGYSTSVRALEFDHLPGSGKVENISHMVANTSYSIADIEAEIAKCEVVCANCHRIRTFTREQHGADHDLHAIELNSPIDDGEPPFEQLALEV